MTRTEPPAPRPAPDLPHCDVLVAGGGLNGPALALALAQAGLRVGLADPAPPRARADAGFDGRAYALALASVRLLEAIGVWSRVAGDAQEITRVEAHDGRPGEGVAPFSLAFDGAELEEGPVGFMLEDRYLYRALLEAVAAEPRITRAGAAVIAEEAGPGRIAVTLSDGTRRSGAVLVGADGRRSGVAARAGIGREGHDYGQTALVAAIDHTLPHHGIAHQVFFAAGPLAILPLPGHRSSIVWSERRAAAAAIAACSDAEFLALLRPRFGAFLGEIALAGPRFSYPLDLTLARSYVAPRRALVGDAAHGVHPIAGQGLNLGLRDVAALAETLVEAARRGEDIGAPAVLARYEAWRRYDATTTALGMDGFNRLFSNDNPLLRTLRDAGLGLVNAAGPLRRAFLRQAAGVAQAPGAGPMPRLLRGLPV